jgi:hypothetical protein
VLRDDSTDRIRPARPGDRDRLEDYFISMSPETRRLRFWARSGDIRGAAAAAALDQDYVHRAEVSFSVADKLQGRGLGCCSPRTIQVLRGFESHSLRFRRCPST